MRGPTQTCSCGGGALGEGGGGGLSVWGRTEGPAEELHRAEEDDDDGAHACAREECQHEVAGDGGEHGARERERQRERRLPRLEHHRLLLHDEPRLHGNPRTLHTMAQSPAPQCCPAAVDAALTPCMRMNHSTRHAPEHRLPRRASQLQIKPALQRERGRTSDVWYP